MSKRHLRRFVEEGVVAGWDDPRMPTLAAMRRRGYSAAAVKDFLGRVGVARPISTVDLALLEHCVREDLGDRAPARHGRAPSYQGDACQLARGLCGRDHHGEPPRPSRDGRAHAAHGQCALHRPRGLMEEPPRSSSASLPAAEVRLKGAYIIRCEEVVHDANGEVAELICSVDMDSRSGSEGANRKVKGTLHWLSAQDACPCEMRLYEPILLEDVPEENAGEEEGEEAEAPAADFMARVNPNSPHGGAGPVRALRGRSGEWQSLPVPAHRLLLQGPGFHEGDARLQPHGLPQGQLGQGQQIKKRTENAPGQFALPRGVRAFSRSSRR